MRQNALFSTVRFYSLTAALLGTPVFCLATEIQNVLPAAFDQPRTNAFVRLQGTTDPLVADFGVGVTFNITAFYDTGASGVLISNQTASLLGVNGVDGIPLEQVGGTNVVYSDVGVGGTQDFNVSVPLEIGLAHDNQLTNDQLDDLDTVETVYTHRFQNVRTQIGLAMTDVDNPLLEGLDVFGMPTMAGKTIVMDNRAINGFIQASIDNNPNPPDEDFTIRTYTYNPGTSFNAAANKTDPGIPATERHVQMSYASFDQFTTVTPAGAPGPTLRNNPFFGPNPVAKLDNPNFDDGTPPIKLSFNGQSTEATFLFDTGAAASIISQTIAGNLGVQYVDGTFGTDAPVLEKIGGGEILNQFSLTIGGIGGTTVLSGFYLDEMLLRTIEGAAGNDLDENHLLFLGAPVLVGDITVVDPVTLQELTLDGIFGMNYLTASADIVAGGPIGIDIVGMSVGAFDWAVFDEPNGTLGLTFATIPEPASLALFGLSAGFVLRRRRRV